HKKDCFPTLLRVVAVFFIARFFYSALFSEKRIFPICFVDINDKPISHTFCVSIEDVKFISSESFDANIKSIPISDRNIDFNKGERFYMFYNNEKVAYCELKSDIK
ncbi:MAG: hypothetical protein UCO74_04365, partial [Ruminococcus sp.]|uniref:hypothetical protein n=1 Tax=Ruminococcus sp. TaxID=41978 RepID=UPI002E77CD51